MREKNKSLKNILIFFVKKYFCDRRVTVGVYDDSTINEKAPFLKMNQDWLEVEQ